MTLQSSGAISFSQINTELNLTSTATISLGDTAVRSLAGVASGAIAMSNLYGKSYFTYAWGGALPAWAGTFPSQTAGSLSAASLSVVINRTAGAGTITPSVTSTPSGWTTSVAPTSASLSASTTTQTFTVTVTPAAGATAGTYNGSITFRDYTYGWSMQVLAAPTALQTKTLTMGFYQENSGTVWEPFTTSYYGYNKVYNSGGLSPNDSDSLWTPSGRWTTIQYYEDDLGNTNVILQIASAVGYAASPNSGFTSVTINGVTYNRASATYSSSGTGTFNFFGDGQRRYATWQWPSVGGVNPFAGLPAGATVQVTWN